MKAPVATLLLSLTLLLSACSWMHEFVLVNKSGTSLEVSYQISTVVPGGVFDSVPLLVNGNQRDTIRHTYDPATQTVTFTCPAGSRVVIGNVLNRTFADYSKDHTAFNLEQLTVSGNGTTETMQSREIVSRTEDKKPGLAELNLR